MIREKRYLLLMPEYVMGGAETQFRYLIEYAEKNKWALDVIVEHRYQKRTALLKEDREYMRNIRIYEIEEHVDAEDRRYQSLMIIKQIIKNLVSVRYQTCLIYSPIDLEIAPIVRMLGVHVIYSERVECADISKKVYLRRCLKFCNRLLANSLYGKRELESITGRAVTVIRNGKPVVQQLPMKEHRQIQCILVPARIVEHKNQMSLLEYMRDHADFKGKIVFAGMVVDRQYERRLKRFVASNHMEERVVFMGYVENMREEYERADIVALPSRLEGTPNVVLEAYAYGRPVIVADIETEKEIVKNPRLRFQLDNTDELDRCIQYVQNLTDEEYEELLRSNRKYVLKMYSIEKMAKKFYQVMTEEI